MPTDTKTDHELSLLSIRPGQVTWDGDQKKALVDVLRVRHQTDSDLLAFFHMARRTQLDPFLRQLYMIAREEWDKVERRKVWRQTFQTGIDGFRVVAQRRARQLGKELTYEDTIYFGPDGKPHNVWLGSEPPAAVRVTVLIGSARYPFTARYDEYVPMMPEYEGSGESRHKTGKMVPGGMWGTRPMGQLEKCAEAGALRRAAAQDLSGIYEFSEMEREGTVPPTDKDTIPSEPTGTDWFKLVKKARGQDALREIWRDAAAAGELSTALRDEITARGERMKTAADRKTKAEANKRGIPATEPGRQCVHGNDVWVGHECEQCQAAGTVEWAEPDDVYNAEQSDGDEAQ